MKCVQVVGYKGSGKSTLIRSLSSILRERGHTVSVIKHAGHDLVFPDKDAAMMKEADRYLITTGEASVLYMSDSFQLLQAISFSKTDILFVEGFKDQYFMPRIVCYAREEEKSELSEGCEIGFWGPEDRESEENLEILADKTETEGFLLAGLNCEACGFDSCKGLLAAMIRGEKTLSDCTVLKDDSIVEIDGYRINLSPFVAAIMKETFGGFLKSLKGVTPGRVRIEFDMERKKKP